jgi:hypothetical protein
MKARRKKNHVPCPDYWDTSSILQDHPDIFRLVRRFPINEIKYDKTRYPNQLDPLQVEEITADFYPDAWEPLWLDPRNNLTDGQHRLHAAKEMRMKFVDVIIYDEELNERKGKARHECRKNQII